MTTLDLTRDERLALLGQISHLRVTKALKEKLFAAVQTPPAPLWRLFFETRHFTFEGYGATRDHALLALRGALDVHAEQYGCEDGWDDGWEDACEREFVLGGGYCDDTHLTTTTGYGA